MNLKITTKACLIFILVIFSMFSYSQGQISRIQLKVKKSVQTLKENIKPIKGCLEMLKKRKIK